MRGEQKAEQMPLRWRSKAHSSAGIKHFAPPQALSNTMDRKNVGLRERERERERATSRKILLLL